MAISVDTVYKFCQFISNKEQSGFFKPKDFNLIAPVAQLNVINELIAKDKELQAKRVGALPSMGSNFKIDQELKDIVEVANGQAVVNQEAAYPSDMMYLISATHNFISSNEQKVVKVKIVDVTREMYLVNSYITPPTAKYPLGVYYSNFLKVYPSTLNTVNMVYLKKPDTPVWGSTIVNGLPVYSSAASTDFVLNPNLFHKLALRILNALGFNLSEERLIAYSSQSRQVEEI